MGSLLLSTDLGSTQLSSQRTPESCSVVQELNCWRPLGSSALEGTTHCLYLRGFCMDSAQWKHISISLRQCSRVPVGTVEEQDGGSHSSREASSG